MTEPEEMTESEEATNPEEMTESERATGPEEATEPQVDQAPSRRLRLSWGGATHQGRVRDNNQDALFADRGLFVVADGMGGHQGGEVASQIAVRTMAGAGHGSLVDLVAAVESSNTAVWEYAENKPELKGMGTTLTGIAVLGDGRPPRFGVVNVGDSRIYRVRDGEIEQITDDHSYVAELVRRGQLNEDESHTHPYRNMLTRAIGVAETVDVDTWEIDPIAGDKFVLCSDGLVNELEDSEILDVFGRVDDPSELARTLIEGANGAGGKDNVTVVAVFVEVDDVEEPPIEAPERDTSPTTSDTGIISPIEDTAAIPVIGDLADAETPAAEASDIDSADPGVATLEAVGASDDPLFSQPVHEDDLPVVAERSDALAEFELPALDNDSPLPWLADGASVDDAGDATSAAEDSPVEASEVFDDDAASLVGGRDRGEAPDASTKPDIPRVQFLNTAVGPESSDTTGDGLAGTGCGHLAGARVDRSGDRCGSCCLGPRRFVRKRFLPRRVCGRRGRHLPGKIWWLVVVRSNSRRGLWHIPLADSRSHCH
ncbi:MAG: Stp1/IreP family PP2C-type Ser/Thr phosphatase [Actinobacteria bacterium]|nr:Stp1/IreP family PP2C-type Ser/Thr phosphatase [Actinomycetota bacterium]